MSTKRNYDYDYRSMIMTSSKIFIGCGDAPRIVRKNSVCSSGHRIGAFLVPNEKLSVLVGAVKKKDVIQSETLVTSSCVFISLASSFALINDAET